MMTKLNHRIWCCDRKEHRELLSVKRNEYGDILFELDSGLTRQFTPHSKVEDFSLERVHIVGLGYDSKTGLLGLLGHVVLKNPQESFGGNLRDIQRTATAEKDHISKRDLEELGQTLTTVTVNTGRDIKNTVTGKQNKTAPVTQETRAVLYEVTDRTIKRWDSGQAKPPEGYDQYADINVMRLNAEKHKTTKKANRAARQRRTRKK